MPALFRVTTFFEGMGQGWSESLVYPALSDTQTNLQFYNTTALPIAQKRAELLGTQFRLTAVRVAKIRNAADGDVKRNVWLDTSNISPSTAANVNTAEQANLACIVEGKNADGTRNKLCYLGGIPDAISQDGGDFNPNGANGWGARFNSWSVLLQAAQAGWLGDTVLHGPIPLDTYITNPGGTISVTCDGVLFDPGDFDKYRMVRIKGVNGKSVLNGAHRVFVDGASTFTTTKAIAVFAYSFGGDATSYVGLRAFVPGAIWKVDAIRTRQRGRPSYVTRGRAAARPRG